MKVTYLDYAATRPMLPSVRARMLELMYESGECLLGNPAALHDSGQNSRDLLDEARIEIADFIGADYTEIIFTSGGTESNNTVMNIFKNRHIAVSAIEHPSVLEPAKLNAKKLDLIPVDEWGRLKTEEIPADADLVSVMLANNELGTILTDQPIQAKNLHIDATQALGKISIDVKKLGADYLTLSAHKIGGPVGIGVLYVREGAKYEPFLRGGHQENHRRAGTANVILAAGFAAAIKEAAKENYETTRKLRDELCRRILKEVPHSSCNTPLDHSLPNILNMSFEAAEGESIQLHLASHGIMVSTGSACASGDAKPSHVLMATRGDAEVAHSSVRFSLGPDTTKDDIDRVMKVLPGIVHHLQQISTVKLKEAHA